LVSLYSEGASVLKGRVVLSDNGCRVDGATCGLVAVCCATSSGYGDRFLSISHGFLRLDYYLTNDGD
jgi:hypothetical protein